MENDDNKESERLKVAIRAFDNTKRRVIPEMPLVVNYSAVIRPITRGTLASGKLVFRTSRPSFYGESEQWERVHLDAFTIRDEFLQATTDRKALNFLRETGEFLPYGDDVSWEDFQLWRDFADQVDECHGLTELHNRQLWGLAFEDLDPTGRLSQMLRMLTGIYDHSYFGPPPPPPPETELEELRRATEASSKTPKQAAKNFAETLRSIEEGGKIARQRQRELEEWFREPPRSAYSLEWIPEVREPNLERKLRQGGAMTQFLPWKSKLVPIMFIHPRCTLEAIASAIYAERVANIMVKRCPGCKTRIEIGKHKGKLYCSERCKAKVQKRRQRKEKVTSEPNL